MNDRSELPISKPLQSLSVRERAIIRCSLESDRCRISYVNNDNNNIIKNNSNSDLLNNKSNNSHELKGKTPKTNKVQNKLQELSIAHTVQHQILATEAKRELKKRRFSAESVRSLIAKSQGFAQRRNNELNRVCDSYSNNPQEKKLGIPKKIDSTINNDQISLTEVSPRFFKNKKNEISPSYSNPRFSLNRNSQRRSLPQGNMPKIYHNKSLDRINLSPSFHDDSKLLVADDDTIPADKKEEDTNDPFNVFLSQQKLIAKADMTINMKIRQPPKSVRGSPRQPQKARARSNSRSKGNLPPQNPNIPFPMIVEPSKRHQLFVNIGDNGVIDLDKGDFMEYIIEKDEVEDDH